MDTVLLSLLDSIGAIVTEHITSESVRLTELLFKIGTSTGVYMTKVCIRILQSVTLSKDIRPMSSCNSSMNPVC